MEGVGVGFEDRRSAVDRLDEVEQGIRPGQIVDGPAARKLVDLEHLLERLRQPVVEVGRVVADPEQGRHVEAERAERRSAILPDLNRIVRIERADVRLQEPQRIRIDREIEVRFDLGDGEIHARIAGHAGDAGTGWHCTPGC